MMAQQNAQPGVTVPLVQPQSYMPMPGFMPQGTMPTGDPSAQYQQQQPFGFFPMMPAQVYPTYPAGQNTNAGFENKN